MAETRRKPKIKTPRKVWVMRVNGAGMPSVDGGDFLGRVKLSRHVTRSFVRDVRGATMAAFDHEIYESEQDACEAAIRSLQSQIDAITAQQDYYRQRIAAANEKGGA